MTGGKAFWIGVFFVDVTKKQKLYKIISTFSPITHIYLLYYKIEKKWSICRVGLERQMGVKAKHDSVYQCVERVSEWHSWLKAY